MKTATSHRAPAPGAQQYSPQPGRPAPWLALVAAGPGVAAIVVAVALACVPGDARAAVTNYPSGKQPVTGPESAIERYAEAFRARSIEGVGDVFTADYVFHARGDSLKDYIRGADREAEMDVIRGLLEGVPANGGHALPPPDTVLFFADGISQAPDPEHPDSAQHYRVLIVRRLEARLTMPNGMAFLVPPSQHVMHVVRGDAAVRVKGQSADSKTWYIRRWLNDVSSVQIELRERDGGCGEEEPTATPAETPAGSPQPGVPVALAIRPLLNPACAELAVSCDLPGVEPARIEVYDVSGRLVNRREVQVQRAGTLTLEAGKGARILPGVYWVRLGQATRPPSTRMVVVAR